MGTREFVFKRFPIWFREKQCPCLNFINAFPLRKNVLIIFLSYDGQMDLSVQDATDKNMGFIVAVFCTNVKIADIKHL